MSLLHDFFLLHYVVSASNIEILDRYEFFCWYSMLLLFMACISKNYFPNSPTLGCFVSRWNVSWPWVPPRGILLHRLPGGGWHDLLHMSEDGLQTEGHLSHTVYRGQRSATVEHLRCQGHPWMCRSVSDMGPNRDNLLFYILHVPL